MSLHEYKAATRLRAADEPFYALIMAAMLRADSSNVARLRAAFPATWDELDARYHAGGGRIPGDAGYDEIQRERAAIGLPPT